MKLCFSFVIVGLYFSIAQAHSLLKRAAYTACTVCVRLTVLSQSLAPSLPNGIVFVNLVLAKLSCVFPMPRP